MNETLRPTKLARPPAARGHAMAQSVQFDITGAERASAAPPPTTPKTTDPPPRRTSTVAMSDALVTSSARVVTVPASPPSPAKRSGRSVASAKDELRKPLCGPLPPM